MTPVAIERHALGARLRVGAGSLGLRRRPGGPPAPHAVDRIPALAGTVTALAGAINAGSVMSGDLPARARAMLAYAPAGEIRLAHAVALPAGLALLGVAWPLVRRRRRAVYVAIGLLVAVGMANIVRSLDLGLAALSWGVAVLLWRSRAAFRVTHDRLGPAEALARSAAVLGGAVLAAGASVAVAASHAAVPLPLAQVPGAAIALVSLSGGPEFREPFGWLPDALGILGVGAVAGLAASLLAPLRLRVASDAVERDRAAALVRRHGSDTLSSFKLRRDVARFFSRDGRAMIGYRVEARAMIIAGDPVGPPDALPGLLAEVAEFAQRHGLALGAVGASREFAELGRRVGLNRLYLGDEAIVAAGPTDLSGGGLKSLRKAVNRIHRHGFRAELRTVGESDAALIAELDELSERWRGGVAERGFSMAHDALVDDHLQDASVVLARDADGRVRGFLHFVPVFGRPAVSLAFMRRDRDTPNGLTEFLVIEAARLLGEQGIEELSLNFAAFGEWIREPAFELRRRALRLADRWFQIERLLSFNAKFRPRWQPRYLLYAGPAQLPRVVLAVMWAEGQLPVPRLPRRRAPREPVPVAAIARVESRGGSAL